MQKTAKHFILFWRDQFKSVRFTFTDATASIQLNHPSMASSPDPSSSNNHQLLQAAFNGNLRLLKKFASEYNDRKIADIRDSLGMSAIHLAASNGHINVCKYLIADLNFDVDVKETHRGRTPLQLAIRESQWSTATYLLEKGANPDIPDDTGATSVHCAAENGRKKLLHILLSRGANVDALSTGGTPLWQASLGGKHEAVEVLLRHHADPNLSYRLLFSPLIASMEAKSLRCLQLLLKAGADPNLCSLMGIRPLDYAIFLGQTDMVPSLIKAGANLNMIDKYGRTSIEVAAELGNTEAVEILLPKTKPISKYSEWSLGGIMKHVNSLEARVQRTQGNEAKLKGDNAFREKDYAVASFYYSTALVYDPLNAALLSNRSLCLLRSKMEIGASKDAMACIALKPEWPKAYYRLGAALSAYGNFEEAAKAFLDGLKLDPENQEMKKAYQEAVEAKSKANHYYSSR